MSIQFDDREALVLRDKSKKEYEEEVKKYSDDYVITELARKVNSNGVINAIIFRAKRKKKALWEDGADISVKEVEKPKYIWE